MPLCGSSTCGCALVSVPAAAGALNSQLPTIDVAGNGTPASPWNLTLNDEWVTEALQRLVWPCTSSTRPTGIEGRCIYETDTDLLLVYSGSVWVPLAGPISGSTSHTMTVAQGATADIAKTINYSKWSYVGFKKIHWTFDIDLTAAGTAGSSVTLTLPLTAVATSGLVGHGSIYDASTTTPYAGVWRGVSTTTIYLSGDWSSSGAWGIAPNLALASGDGARGSIVYEIA